MTGKPFDASTIHQWDFSVLDIDGFNEDGFMVEVGKACFAEHDLIRSLGLSEERVERFLSTLDSKYAKTHPYHGAAHAADVAINVNYLLRSGFARFFSKVEVLVLCVAALGHDLGHFALNNMFLINSNHELVQKFGATSSLEHYHLSLLKELLEDETCYFLDSLSTPDRATFNTLVTELVLATDMSQHRNYFTKFENWYKSAKSEYTGPGSTGDDQYHKWVEAKIPTLRPEDRSLLLAMVLKCADLANVVKPLKQAEGWAERIMMEFFAQGEREVSLSLPVTQPSRPDDIAYLLAKHQLGFLENVVGPLYTAMMELADKDSRATVLSHIRQNGEAWRHKASLEPPGNS
uniref:PDEase domain-containing protein n=1 Tax=Pyramimonas obovata TaxID=1411642 RepID=A0A7S0R760_9CHLO|mmetsp:Transcript_26884/g.58647  ORF Transcript_26884/g.58647 Transcript_26884/m.58647 type:complete len:348 (+) Transcript_26884:75-1118(+)|eukprot:CAMPEP_0118923584 /NCGR_PEP_ID=MMETSP1169-20130426/2055_1 /TAXON_ID=36882 /ORGANISM="Pyramimonas obovata, Strain CCMP722" /LENGTH=347 /DNA_ID=CAMNT_0006864597 /DNA_START=46 /DNA_END=1089 /DNA_ORIENTATION=+